MIYPQVPKNEKERQDAVNKYKNLKELSSESYDNITSLIATICDAPIALISIIDNDRNFFKSNYGLDIKENTRSMSFCGHSINSDLDIFIVEDSRIDQRFCDNPFVLNGMAIFYAGVTLITSDGYKLGTLCVYDSKPRILNDNQKTALKILAKQVIILFEKEYQNTYLNNLKESLKNRNDELEKFAGIISHDLKSPLANIISLTQLIEEENKNLLSQDSQLYLKYLKSSSFSLRNYIDGLLSFYKSDSFMTKNNEVVNLNLLIEEVKKMLPLNDKISIKINFETPFATTDKAALQQIILNLVSNAIRYNSKENINIQISFHQDEKFLFFKVKDNGNGITQENYVKIFELFQVLELEDYSGEKGSGIGLATVKKVVENLGGTIELNSEVNVGSEFIFTISK